VSFSLFDEEVADGGSIGDSSFFVRGLSIAGLARVPADSAAAVDADADWADAAPRIEGISLTSDPNRLARAAARSSSGVMVRGGPILCAEGFWGRFEAAFEGPVGAFDGFSGVPFVLPLGAPGLAGVVGGTDAVDRVARGPAGGGWVAVSPRPLSASMAAAPCFSEGPAGGAELKSADVH
jgi:hypothetical protein